MGSQLYHRSLAALRSRLNHLCTPRLWPSSWPASTQLSAVSALSAQPSQPASAPAVRAHLPFISRSPLAACSTFPCHPWLAGTQPQPELNACNPNLLFSPPPNPFSVLPVDTALPLLRGGPTGSSRVIKQTRMEGAVTVCPACRQEAQRAPAPAGGGQAGSVPPKAACEVPLFADACRLTAPVLPSFWLSQGGQADQRCTNATAAVRAGGSGWASGRECTGGAGRCRSIPAGFAVHAAVGLVPGVRNGRKAGKAGCPCMAARFQSKPGCSKIATEAVSMLV